MYTHIYTYIYNIYIYKSFNNILNSYLLEVSLNALSAFDCSN